MDCELDTAEVAADGRDDDRVVIHTVRDVFPSELVPALGRLGQGPGHEQLRHVLWRVAPSWLVQLPALVDEGELEALQRKVQGVPRQRMLLSAAITATQGYRAEEVVQNLSAPACSANSSTTTPRWCRCCGSGPRISRTS